MDPATDSGGRVTRSLRKRIASVDGDNSSRPGTPVPSKLTGITEISSPSRPTRITRRNSTSGVATPGKRSGTPSVIAESTEAVTPARRNTRRRSLSINEGEETPHTIKVPVFEAVAEEVTTSVKPTTSRRTRLQSKSPDKIQAISPAKKNNVKSPESIKSGEKNTKTKSLKRRKPGPKSKTRLTLDEHEVLSDVEVIVVENEESTENQPNINVNIVDLLDCDNDKTNLIAEKSQIENELANSPQTSTTKDDLKLTNAEVTVSDKTIMMEYPNEHQHLENTKLSNEECNDSTHNSLSSIELEHLDDKKPDKTSQVDENVTIIDLMDCDDESQELTYTKAPEENKVSTTSTDSPKGTDSKSHLENDTETDANDKNENIFDVDDGDADAECIMSKPIHNMDEEMANESESEEISTMDSHIVINETLFQNSKTEITDANVNEIDVNESKIKESPMNNLQEKDNLMEIKFDPSDAKALEDIAYQQKDMASATPNLKSTATIIEVVNINSYPSTPTTQETSLKKVEFVSSPRLSANKFVNLNVPNTDETSQVDNNISVIDLMDCDEKPQQLPEENKITNLSADSPKTILIESNLENDKDEIDEIAHNESIFDVNGAECIAIKPTNIHEEMTNELSESRLENDNETDANDKNENIFDVDDADAECITIKPTNKMDEEMANEEIPTRDSLTVINKSLPNNTNSEKQDINVNEIAANKSAVNNLQEKNNLPELDVENKIMALNPSNLNSKDLEDNSMTSVTSERKSSATTIEVSEVNSVAQNIPSKKVEFSSSPIRDDTIKSVYPKTPAIIKSKRFIGTDSARDENNTTAGEIPECPQDEMEIDEPAVSEVSEYNHALHKLPEEKDITEQLEELGSSVISNDPKSPEQISETIDKVSSPIVIENQLKWINPSVKGLTNEGCKLDAVVIQANTPENCNVHNDEDEKPFTRKKAKAIIFSSDSNDEEEEEEAVELAPDEKLYKRKHIFHDDEALEVDDYESGDSMDSEEKREILENEIPIDAESIGSATTTDDENDEDYVEEGESEDDSFIVSDNEKEENESTDSDDEGDIIDNNARKKRKICKRIRHPTELLSSDDLEKNELDSDEDDNTTIDNIDRKKKKNHKSIQLPIESSSSDDLEKEETDMKIKSNMKTSFQESNKIEFDLGKLSDSALRLQCTAESESEKVEEETKANISRKEILRKLNQSDRFNKSVRDLNPEVDTSPIEHNEREKSKVADNVSDCENDSQMSMSEEIEEKIENEQKEEDQDKAKEIGCTDGDSSTSSSGENIRATSRKNTRESRSESQLGEVSVTTESDGDKENNNKIPSSSSNRMPGGGGLSVSFGNFKKTNKHSTERKEWQRSFTIGVSVKGCGLGTAVTENKSTIENTSSSPTFSDVDQDDKLSSDDVRDLEKIRHMPLPLGNPLVRTRRQSLALPSNPDKEICSSPYCGGQQKTSKNSKRKSLGVLSTNEFNPSQSFIDSIELRKNEFVRNSAKRKRLSKSFCGASETLDNSIIDIDVVHLHKRSKLARDNNSMMENYHGSIENINTCKLSSKAAISSTPCEKVGQKDSNNNVKRILSRCDEILEAANRAKLEIKTNNKKSKVKLPKRNRKKPAQHSIQEVHQGDDDESKTFAKQKKHNDKIKAAALEQALKAADDVIHGKKIEKRLRPGDLDEDDEEDSKRIPCDVLEEIAENVKNNNQKDVPTKKQRKLRDHVTTVTTSGNFVELPQTPEKKKQKKRVEIIKLPTGKMCVEPITPKTRSVLACNGFEFHESPITPFSVGFKVRQIPSTLKDRKRKRNFDDQPMHTLPQPQPQWTQSGLFIEEEISTMRHIARSEVSQMSGSRKMKKLAKANDEQNAYCNFKQNALMRGDIKRCTTRDILQLKERRQMQNQF